MGKRQGDGALQGSALVTSRGALLPRAEGPARTSPSAVARRASTAQRRRALAGGALLLLPLLITLGYFLLFPLAFLLLSGLRTPTGLGPDNYLAVLANPRYRAALLTSLQLSASVTIVSMVLSTLLAFFLARRDFRGKSLYLALFTFPLSFPGVVVGFMMIVLFGRTGAVPQVTQLLFGVRLGAVAYTLGGLFLAYLYFELPRITMTLMAAVAKIDTRLEDAARSLGAGPVQTARLVTLPAIRAPLVSASALAFATAMGAFGTAFALAERLTILPIVIYDEYVNFFRIEAASAMAVVLGLFTVVILFGFRRLAEERVDGPAPASAARVGA